MSEVEEYNNKYSYILKGKKGKNYLIPVLQEIQAKEGYLAAGAIIAVANSLEVPLAHVYGVCTFYNFFKLKKQGQNIISLCEGTACHVKGAPNLMKVIKDKLGVGPGEMTKDGKYSVEIVRCLGLCAFAPVLMINEKVYSKITPDELKKVLDDG